MLDKSSQEIEDIMKDMELDNFSPCYLEKDQLLVIFSKKYVKMLDSISDSQAMKSLEQEFPLDSTKLNGDADYDKNRFNYKNIRMKELDLQIESIESILNNLDTKYLYFQDSEDIKERLVLLYFLHMVMLEVHFSDEIDLSSEFGLPKNVEQAIIENEKTRKYASDFSEYMIENSLISQKVKEKHL